MRQWKLIIKSALIMTALMVATNAMAGENPFKPKAPFKSAVVQYTHNGSEKGKSTTYYQGTTTADHRQTSTKLWGVDQGTQDTITITEPKKVIVVDLAKRTAKATGNPMDYMAQEYEKLTPAEKARVKKNAEKMGQSMLNLVKGGKAEIKEGTFMGKPVQIVTAMGLKGYVWKDKGVILKQEGSLLGMKLDTVATKVDVGASVPADKFKVPAGIKVVFDKEADQKQRQMAKNMMDMLKDPDFGKNKGGMAGQPSDDDPGQASQEKEGDPVKEGMNLLKKTLGW
jgi:riboflavin synthase